MKTRFKISQKEAENKIKQVQDLFAKGKRDEEIAKATGTAFAYVGSVRRAFGLYRAQAGINIFEDTKKTQFNEYSGKIGVVFWIPIKEAKALGLTESSYEFLGSILGKQKMQLTFKDVE